MLGHVTAAPELPAYIMREIQHSNSCGSYLFIYSCIEPQRTSDGAKVHNGAVSFRLFRTTGML